MRSLGTDKHAHVVPEHPLIARRPFGRVGRVRHELRPEGERARRGERFVQDEAAAVGRVAWLTGYEPAVEPRRGL